MPMEVMDIVETQGGSLGVVIEVLTDGEGPNEYRVQLVDKNGHGGWDGTTEYTRSYVGLFNRDQVTSIGYCENDSEQALVLCAAAGVAYATEHRRTGC